MLLTDQIHGVAEMSETLLTAYLNTGNLNSSRHPRVPAHLAWFRKEAAGMAETLTSSERKQFLKQAGRIEDFLEGRRPEEKALVIFAGTKTWTVTPLQTRVQNELRWERPALGQAFRLLSEHPVLGVVAVDHQTARLFAYRLGELSLLHEKTFAVDKSEWKQKELGHVTGEGVRKTRGSNRDVYEHRLEAQYERLCHETAEEGIKLWKKFEFAGLFLIGPDRLVNFIRAKLPQPYNSFVTPIPEDLGKFTPREILQRVEKRIAEFEQKRQLTLVVQLLFEEGKLKTNPDEILAQMQNGSIHTLLVASDVEIPLHQCAKCGFASRIADPACVRCSGALQKVSLLELLPRLAAKHHIKVEFVSGEAARQLAKIGGIGGWSRQAGLRATG